MKKNAIKNKNFDSVFHRLYLIPKQVQNDTNTKTFRAVFFTYISYQ